MGYSAGCFAVKCGLWRSEKRKLISDMQLLGRWGPSAHAIGSVIAAPWWADVADG